MKRYVIYSAMVGGYDQVLQPSVIDDRFDYVLFTNEVADSKVGVWQICPIKYQNEDNTRICRYVKTHPETLLPEYEASVWIDMNVLIKTQFLYDFVIRMLDEGIEVSSMCHPFYRCIYDEAFSVMNLGIEHESVVLKWCGRLRKENYPVNNGLCETNVLFRKHNEKISEIDTYWWECIEGNSRRDQLSFNYVLWKKGTPCHYLLGEGKCVRNTEHFGIVNHKNSNHNFCGFDKYEGWLMRYCRKIPAKTDMVKKTYFRLYSMPFPQFWAFLMGQFFRVKYLLTKK